MLFQPPIPPEYGALSDEQIAARIAELKASFGTRLVSRPTCAAARSTSFARCARPPRGTCWAIGTEVHLVHRLAAQHPDKRVRSLADVQCLCTTMYRIDPRHLLWSLDRVSAGDVANQITADADTRKWSHIALERMLELRPAVPVSAK